MLVVPEQPRPETRQLGIVQPAMDWPLIALIAIGGVALVFALSRLFAVSRERSRRQRQEKRRRLESAETRRHDYEEARIAHRYGD